MEFPSEERLLGERLYKPIVVAVLAAGEARAAEEDLAWHRAEVARLRGLLTDLEGSGGVTRVQVELGPRRVCITAPTEAGEHAANDALLAWAAERGVNSPEVAAELQALTERASLAEAFAGLLACALSLPQEGKRLGPGPCEALKKLGEEKGLIERCRVAMRHLLDANKDALAARAFAVDADEWGSGAEEQTPEPAASEP